MRKKQHRNALSNTNLRRIVSNKYNRVHRSVPLPDLDKIYDKRKDGWRKKKVEVKNEKT